MKRLLSVVLVVLLLLTCIPLGSVSVSAVDYEYAMFPMEYLNVTQGGNGNFSHQGTKAIDLGGRDTGIDSAYAPFTGTIKRIYNSYVVWLESNNPVVFADGTIDYMTVMFMHDDDTSDLSVGQNIRQGERFFEEGQTGYAKGNHIHLECMRGKYTKWYENSYGEWTHYNAIDPSDALFLAPSTVIKNDGGYNWRYTSHTEHNYAELQPGTYYFKNNGSGTYLDVEYEGDANNQNVFLANYPGTVAFEVTGTKSSYALRPLCSTSRLLNSYGNTVKPGCNVCLWDDTGDASQRWLFEKTEEGYVIYNAQNTSCVLDTTYEGNVYVETRVESAAGQYWSIQNTVQYDANGGTGAPSTQFKEYGEGLNLSSTKPTRSGYTFAGWATSASATTAQYQPGDTYTANKNVTLYAVWKKTNTLKITSQPQSTYVEPGGSAVFSVQATGEELLYRWHYKQLTESEYNTWSTPEPVFSITLDEENNNMQLYCVITDKYGNQVTTDMVFLRIKATITTQPKTAYAKMGSTVQTSVKATGDGLNYAWYICDADEEVWYKSSINAATYAIKMTTLKSNRKVYCIVTDKYGNEVKSDMVRLRAKAAITTQPKTAYAKVGAKAKTTVTATGDGLKYTWYVKDAGGSKYTKSSITSSTYSVSMTTAKSDRRVYCVVSDKYGNKEQTNTVLLRTKVAITTQPKTAYAKIGAKATVSVKATGNGLKYVWYVKNAGNSKYTKSSITSSTYSVKMASKVNGRKLICYVYDKYGNKVQSNTVMLKKK